MLLINDVIERKFQLTKLSRMKHNFCLVRSKTFDSDWLAAILRQWLCSLSFKFNQDRLLKFVLYRELFACCRPNKNVAELQFLFLNFDLF